MTRTMNAGREWFGLTLVVVALLLAAGRAWAQGGGVNPSHETHTGRQRFENRVTIGGKNAELIIEEGASVSVPESVISDWLTISIGTEGGLTTNLMTDGGLTEIGYTSGVVTRASYALPFTITATNAGSLSTTAADLSASDLRWYRITTGSPMNWPITTGKTLPLSSVTSGSWTLACSDWSKVTVIDFNTKPVSGNISGWRLPSSLVTLRLYSTSVSGDISGWTLPSSLASISLFSTSVSGNISGWTLPSSLALLNLTSTSVSGDISGWTLPSSLSSLYLSITSVSGDISEWTLPSSMSFLHLNTTSVDYDSTSGAFASSVKNGINIRLDGCSLTTNQVDNVLVDLDTSGATGGTLNIAGTGGTANAAPSVTGIASRLSLSNKTWTVTTN
jgi:hypothetical protein